MGNFALNILISIGVGCGLFATILGVGLFIGRAFEQKLQQKDLCRGE